jgi:eukaryotic-like serine/threonine-protein kinase
MNNVAPSQDGLAEDRFRIVGKVVARTYRVESVVAEGGFGVVYRADHKGFRAKVALKCLKIPGSFNEVERQTFLEQFRSEAEVLFRLSSHNPHIVRPLHVDAFHTDDRQLVPFLALEWLEGRTLGALITARARAGKAPLSLERVVRLLTPVAQALVFAHNLPDADGKFVCVVHRDLKPENIFITRVGEEDVPKVLDFGISKAKSAAEQLAGHMSQVTNAVSAFSPAYASPEQWSPKRLGQTGPWTDVWGLALTVVETAKGADVIEGDQAEMMASILDASRRPTPRNEGLTVSDEVEAVFQRALAVDPKTRYQSVGEFWDALTLALGLRQELGGVLVRPQVGRGHVSSEVSLDSATPPLSPASRDEAPIPSQVRSPIRQPHSRFEPPRPASAGQAPPPPGVASSPLGSPQLGSPHQLGASSRPPAGEMRPRLYSSLLDVRSPLADEMRSRPQGSSGPVVSGVGRTQARGATSPLELQAVSRRPQRASTVAPPGRTLWKELSPAFALMLLSVAVTVLDRTFAGVRGVPLVIGSIRMSWLGGAIMVTSFLVIFALLRKRQD